MGTIIRIGHLVLLVIIASCSMKYQKNNSLPINIIWQYKCIEYFDKKFPSYVTAKMALCVDKQNAAEEYYNINYMIKKINLDIHYNKFHEWSKKKKVNSDTLIFTQKLDARLILIDSPIIVTKWYTIKNNVSTGIILTISNNDTMKLVERPNNIHGLEHELKIEDGCNDSVAIISRFIPKYNKIDILHIAINPEDSM